MVFSSVTFLFYFLPLCLLGYVIVPRRLRNGWLLASSLVFYVWGSGALVALLAISTAVDYAMGWLVHWGRESGSRRLVRVGVGTSVVVNVSLLAYFKYANFFVEQVNRLEIAGIDWSTVTLPVGISFFTFQSMSYTLDVARGRADHLRNPFDFGLYVALFPQLVAGPIVRFHEIATQIRDRATTLDRFADGVVRFAHGLGKKVVIADSVAPIADAAFSSSDMSAPVAWLGIAAYTVQIYFDFSGYSDMAIGLGLMFGFDFPENFRRPYSALSVTDFWRRWHITLSNWFRDYVYIPLGGSHSSERRTLGNLWLVFVLTGIWHGANWTFLVWGLYHGLLLVAERTTGQRRLESRGGVGDVARRVAVLLSVMVGWVFFRAASVGAAFSFLGDMFSPGGGMPDAVSSAITNRSSAALVVGLLACALPRSVAVGPVLVTSRSRFATTYRFGSVFIVLPYALLLVASGTFSPFLYFQF